ncbi:MAG: MATE family efflux transporter [Lachnospiraceae bacterium]|nr:MATE family efflux transporter [Lachnospiraceae bacterium]
MGKNALKFADFSRKDLLILIWPLLIEQLLSVAMGFVDMLMVSGVGDEAVSAVGLVDSLNNLLIQLFAALAGGGAVVCSQYLGRKDRDNAKKAAGQLYFIIILASSLIALSMIIFNRPVLSLIFGSIDESVMTYCIHYLLITSMSFPFLGIYNAGSALFRAQGDSIVSMQAGLVMNIMNVVGNALLIYVFNMEVIGAALATLIGRVVASLFVSIRLRRNKGELSVKHIRDLKPEKQMIKRILAIGIPSGVENSMFQIGKLILSSLVSSLGTVSIAANAVANSISGIANIPGSTISLAMMPVVGRLVGAGKRNAARYYGKLLTGIAFVGLFITNITLFFTIPYIVPAFGLSNESAMITINVIRWFNVFSIGFWGFSFTLPNALRAGGDAKFTMIVSTISMWAFRVILSYIFVLVFNMGLLGIWLGMFIDWIFRSICFIIRFHSGKWLYRKVI